MELAVIAPIGVMDRLCPQGDIELVLGNMLQHTDYLRYYLSAKQAGRKLILDNGIMELGHALGTDALFDLMDLVSPDLVTPPEVLHNGPETLKLTRQFLAALEARRHTSSPEVLGVAHGASLSEWLNTFDALNSDARISRIGIPYDVPFAMRNDSAKNDNQLRVWARRRVLLTEKLAELYGADLKEVHLLGLAHPSELPHQAHHKFIKSHDSSWPVMAGIGHAEYPLDLDVQIEEKPFIQWHARPNEEQLTVAEVNITRTKAVISGYR